MCNHYRTVLLSIAALITTGCLSPRIAQREIPVALPSTFVAMPAANAGLELCARLAPPEASTWLARVDDGNLDLRVATARLRQAEAIANATASTLWPRLDGRLEATRSNTPFVAGALLPRSGVSTTWQGSIAASYEIDTWNRLRNETDAARLDAQSARQALESLSLTLRAQTLDIWIGAVAQQQLVGLLASQTETSERFLELTRLRFGLGQVPGQDIGRQKQQLLSLQGQNALVSAQAALLTSRLEALSGSVPGSLALDNIMLPPAPAIPDPGLPASVVVRRPDVLAAAAALAASDRRVAAAVAQRLPSLRLDASLLSIESQLANIFTDAFWSVGAALSGNIFDRGGHRARIELSRAQADEAAANYAGTLLQALREVHDALIRNASQDRFASSLAAQYEEATRVLTLTRDAYRQGQVSYLDVLTALSSQQGLERQIVDAQAQQLSNRVDLCRAAGVAPGARTI